MDVQDGKFTTKDGYNLYWKSWIPEKPKSVIHLIHGLAEHTDRYKNIVDKLVPAGYAIFGNDHRGHGRSDGKRCHVMNFQEYIDDERQFYQEVIQKRFPDLTYFVLGHSMGSFIAMNYAEQFPEGIKGLVLSGTGAGPGAAINKVLIFATRIASMILPGIHVKSPLPPDFISRDKDVVKAYIDDPYVYDIITPRLADQMNRYIAIAAQDAGKITMPVIIQYGSMDNSLSKQETLYASLGASDKTIKKYDGLKHEIYNELPKDRALVLDDLHKWLEGHM